MRKTLYEQHRDNYDALAGQFPSLVAMAKQFTTAEEMGAAIGVTGAAVSKWGTGAHRPSSRIEAAASHWLARTKSQAAVSTREVTAAPDLPLFRADKSATSGVTTMVVTCAEDAAPKFQRVAAMMGCTVEVL